MPAPRNKRYRVPQGFEGAFRAFQGLPNIGPATAEDLVRLRVRSVADLARRDPLTLYRRLCRLDGATHDPCVLDVFLAAVDHARTGSGRPWWAYTAERKAILAAGRGPAQARPARAPSRAARAGPAAPGRRRRP